jgi:hypothetical protein
MVQHEKPTVRAALTTFLGAAFLLAIGMGAAVFIFEGADHFAEILWDVAVPAVITYVFGLIFFGTRVWTDYRAQERDLRLRDE